MHADDSTRLRLAHADRTWAAISDGGTARPAIVGRVLTAAPLQAHFIRVQPVTATGTATEGGTPTLTDQGPEILADVWGQAPMTGDLVTCWHAGYRWVTGAGRVGPPCTWSLTVQVSGECTGHINGATIVYTKPDGSTITHVLSPSQWADSIADPDPGTWTIAVHSPTLAFDDAAPVTVTVEQCHSQTLAVSLPWHYRTLHYSDDYGSITATLGSYEYCPTRHAAVCGWDGSYDYTTTNGAERVDCGYGNYVLIGPRTGDVPVHFRFYPYYDQAADTIYLEIQRWYYSVELAYTNCTDYLVGGYCLPAIGGFPNSLAQAGRSGPGDYWPGLLPNPAVLPAAAPTWTGTLLATAWGRVNLRCQAAVGTLCSDPETVPASSTVSLS
jgi:hypothetical protein